MTPLLMQSLPNSGSTWFAALLAQHIPGCRYYDKEFFNPVCNLKHELLLREQFGCELVSCYRNIATPGDEGIDAVINRTWGAEDYTFTKECNSAFKTAAFVRHFSMFAFLRRSENTFPSRARVWSFYEHAWHALNALAGYRLHAVTTKARAIEAHSVLSEVIMIDAACHGVPVIWWEEVMHDPASIMDRLRMVTPVSDSFIDAIKATSKERALV